MRRLYLYKKFTEDGVAIRDAAANIARSDDEVFVVTEHDRKHEELDKAIETSRAHDIIIVKTMDNMGQAADDTLKRLRTIMEKRICFISCDMKMTYEHGVSPDLNQAIVGTIIEMPDGPASTFPTVGMRNTTIGKAENFSPKPSWNGRG